jgi:hypothetical protein
MVYWYWECRGQQYYACQVGRRASGHDRGTVTSVHDQQPVQRFGPDSPNEPLRDPIRLRRLKRRANDSGALGLKHRVEAASEFGIVIANQETNRVRTLSECPRDLSGLLRHPLPLGCEVHPARCTRRLAISMKTSTYNRWNEIVSTMKKSVAMTLFACARRNSRYDGPPRVPAEPTCFSRRTFRTVVADTAMPSPFSSPTMR